MVLTSLVSRRRRRWIGSPGRSSWRDMPQGEKSMVCWWCVNGFLMSLNCVFPMFWFLLIVFEWELDVFDADPRKWDVCNPCHSFFWLWPSFPLWIQWIFHGFSYGEPFAMDFSSDLHGRRQQRAMVHWHHHRHHAANLHQIWPQCWLVLPLQSSGGGDGGPKRALYI